MKAIAVMIPALLLLAGGAACEEQAKAAESSKTVRVLPQPLNGRAVITDRVTEKVGQE